MERVLSNVSLTDLSSGSFFLFSQVIFIFIRSGRAECGYYVHSGMLSVCRTVILKLMRKLYMQ